MSVMTSWSDNIEAVARALCAKRLARDDWSEEILAAKVDMWWHLVAAELEAGVVRNAVDLRLEATRRRSANVNATEHGIGLRLSARW